MKLSGIRVLDLSLIMPGPHMTQVMCDHGADVISVEPPAGDPARELGPVRNGYTPWFRNIHRGKKCVLMNLKDEHDCKKLLSLFRRADVFVEGFRPGVADRLGFGYERLSQINPRIVYCSISAFGQYGPYRERPAHDLSIAALAGTLSLNLGDNGKPALPSMPAADMSASLMALSGVLMALYRRQITGRGDYIDISMHDSLLGWTQNVIGPVFAEGIAPDVANARGWGGRAFYNIYETADGGYITLSGNESKFVEVLLCAFSRPDLINVAKSDPGPHQKPLIEFFRNKFSEHSQAYWSEWFRNMDVCFAPMLSLKEAFEDEHAKARDMILFDENENMHVGVPIKFLEEPAEVRFEVFETSSVDWNDSD